jgi:hypothetical protein
MMWRPLGCLLVMCSMASAAEMRVKSDTGTPVTDVIITGEIEPGDQQTFKGIITGREQILVVLDSPGGDLAARNFNRRADP